MNTITSHSIYLEMRDHIVSGRWEPGMRLVQRTLAKEFGASSIPIIESIRRLESDQLVVSHPNAGAQVRTWTERDVESVYSARAALEGVTCRLFAEQASDSEKAKAASLSRQFDHYYLEKSLEASAKADIQFHLYVMNRSVSTTSKDALSALAQNAFLLSSTIHSVTFKYVAALEGKVPFGGPVGVHNEIVEAFNAGDGDAAERAIHYHINAARQTVLNAINIAGFPW